MLVMHFVPATSSIDSQVITLDICRYLDNDALVRPGSHKVSSQKAARITYS